MTLTNIVRTISPVLALLAGCLSAAAQAGDTCKVPLDAERKMIVTAHHSYETRSQKNKTRTDETIYMGGLNGAVYIKVKGQWMHGFLTPAESLKQKEENIRNAKNSCRYLRDEAVGGESAAVYSIHSETEDSKTDGTVWVGKTSGLSLRAEVDIDGGMHSSVRYEYSNVHAPEGVK